MDPSQFTATAPGQLVETRGKESIESSGRISLVEFDGQAFLPAHLPPDLDFERVIGSLWRDFDRARKALATLDATANSLPNPHLLSRPFGIREAQASSRIENTIASAEEIVFEELGERREDKSREVLNYLSALEWALEAEAPLSQWTIRTMHRMLLDGVRGSDRHPGEYRSGQAYLKGVRAGFAHARFVPPPAQHVPPCMDALEAFIKEPSEDLPEIMVLAMAHYQFETIHPFADGNGRVGRLLLLLSLCRYGLLSRPLISVSAFFDRNQDAYYDLLLRVSTHGDWASWVRFVCQAICEEAWDAQRRADRLIALRRDFLARVTEPRASSLLRELVDFIFTRPAIHTADARDRLGISHQQAQRHVNRLVSKGILREITGRSYDRVYLARDVINVIESDAIDP